MGGPVLSCSRVIPAPRQAIFDLLADPAQHPKLDGSSTVQASAGSNPTRLSLGATFAMSMKLGPVPYKVTNRVVEFEEGSLIAWRHYGGHIWRYQLEDVEGGTKVTETFGGTGAKSSLALKVMGVEHKHPAAMAATLATLEDVTTGP